VLFRRVEHPLQFTLTAINTVLFLLLPLPEPLRAGQQFVSNCSGVQAPAVIIAHPSSWVMSSNANPRDPAKDRRQSHSKSPPRRALGEGGAP